MRFWRNIKAWWADRGARRERRRVSKDPGAAAKLREFVYLDDVSLKSLLISQTGTLLTSTTRSLSQTDEAEVNSRVSAGNSMVGSAEMGSRLRSGSTSGHQATYKAEVQTQFKAFVELPAVSPTMSPKSRRVEKFSRGDLVEVEVELSVDNLYELIAITDSFGDMAEAAPQILGGTETANVMNMADPVRKLLDQLMAGLVPIKAKALNHVVIMRDENPIVVARSELDGDERSEAQDLYIVGVTEGARYWRDLRRVVFSKSPYTMMVRVARDGLQRDWTPVKGAHLFDGIAPDFMPQLRKARLHPLAQGEGVVAQGYSPRQKSFADALNNYKDALLSDVDVEWSSAVSEKFGELIDRLSASESSLIKQSEAFEQVQRFVLDSTPQLTEPDNNTLYSMREQARMTAGFSMVSESGFATSHDEAKSTDSLDEWLLDTEVIAIYW